MNRQLARFAVVAATALLLAGCTSGGLGGVVPDKGSKDGPQVGVTEWLPGNRDKPITLSGDLLTGPKLDLASLHGDVVVINIWGSWCGPCRAEAPALVTAYDQLTVKGVRFVGIDTQDTADAAKVFLVNNKEVWPSLVDDDGKLLLAFRGKVNPTAVPFTMVLDRQGRVAARVVGAVRTDTLTALVNTVLQEPVS
jgi:thiol-disulfide isomerase/thioredoxin